MKGSLEFLSDTYEDVNMLLYGHKQRVVFFLL